MLWRIAYSYDPVALTLLLLINLLLKVLFIFLLKMLVQVCVVDLVDWRGAATVKQRHDPSAFEEYTDRCIHVGGESVAWSPYISCQCLNMHWTDAPTAAVRIRNPNIGNGGKRTAWSYGENSCFWP